MATVNYSWNLPTVGGSEDTWGTSLNANWTDLDTLLGGVSQTEFAILDGATVSTAELNILDGVTATTAEINQLDGNGFTADVLPDADSTRDLGSSSKAWALAYLDAIEPVGADTTIKRVGGTNSTPIVEGIAKAWVNFNGTGTIAARDSLNVSSLTDNATGDYTVNLTSSFSAVDYAIAASNIGDGTGTNRVLCTMGSNNVSTVGGFNVRYMYGGIATDNICASCIAHGDLA